jgi:hypothetical protein
VDEFGTRGRGEGSQLEDRFRRVIPGATVEPAKVDSGYIGFEDAWTKGHGSGAATAQLRELIPPQLIDKIDKSQPLRDMVLRLFDQSNEREALDWDPARRDLQNAREIFSKEGLSGLFEALEKGAIALPAAALILGPLLPRQSQGPEAG